MKKKITEKEKKKRKEILSDPVKFMDEVIKGIDEYCKKTDRLELSRKFNIPPDEVEDYLLIIMRSRELKELMIMAMGNI